MEVTRSRNPEGDTYFGIDIINGNGIGDHAKGVIGMYDVKKYN